MLDRKLLVRFAVRETMGIVMLAVALFWPAGTLRWWQGWALVAVTAAWVLGTGIVIARNNPGLFAERLGPRKGSQRWDTALGSIRGLLQIAILVLAGFDHRHAWSASIPVAAQIIAVMLCALGYGAAVWATAANAFFSAFVRIQTERGHTVVTDGPYRIVRHPAYAGGLLTALSTPILLGSWWALPLGVVDAVLVVLRTQLEDRTLLADLPGYAEYAGRVRSRLVPGVW